MFVIQRWRNNPDIIIKYDIHKQNRQVGYYIDMFRNEY